MILNHCGKSYIIFIFPLEMFSCGCEVGIYTLVGGSILFDMLMSVEFSLICINV